MRNFALFYHTKFTKDALKPVPVTSEVWTFAASWIFILPFALRTQRQMNIYPADRPFHPSGEPIPVVPASLRERNL